MARGPAAQTARSRACRLSSPACLPNVRWRCCRSRDAGAPPRCRWDRARLWRVYFLNDVRGFWEPSAGLALALQAVRAPRENIARRPLASWAPRFPTVWRYIGNPPKGLTAEEHQALPRAGWREKWAREAAGVREELRTACPLSEPSVEAFEWSQPEQLKELAGGSQGLVTAERLWTTLLCRAWLQDQQEHFLVMVRFSQPTPAGEEPLPPRTAT